MKLNCASCRYYSAKSCHRWPPIGYEDTAAPPHAIFPPVALTDWCGEYAEVAEVADESEPTPKMAELTPEQIEAVDGYSGISMAAVKKASETLLTYGNGQPADKPKRGRPRRG